MLGPFGYQDLALQRLHWCGKPESGARAALPSPAASTIFGVPISPAAYAEVVWCGDDRLRAAGRIPRRGENRPAPADHDRVKTLHLVLELCRATAIIDLPNPDFNGAARKG